MDFVSDWSQKTEIPASRFVGWLGIGQSKFHDWKDRYGKRNEHNGWVPRDWWLEDWEKQAIIRFSFEYPLEGYRRLAFMMLDRDVVAESQIRTVIRAYRDKLFPGRSQAPKTIVFAKDDAHAASVVKLGPCSPRTLATRPAMMFASSPGMVSSVTGGSAAPAAPLAPSRISACISGGSSRNLGTEPRAFRNAGK